MKELLRKIKSRKANWTSHISSRDCLLKHITEGKKERRTDRSDGKMRKKT
jgi:hypothetical protein